jgi:hypothetical protein
VTILGQQPRKSAQLDSTCHTRVQLTLMIAYLVKLVIYVMMKELLLQLVALLDIHVQKSRHSLVKPVRLDNIVQKIAQCLCHVLGVLILLIFCRQHVLNHQQAIMFQIKNKAVRVHAL